MLFAISFSICAAATAQDAVNKDKTSAKNKKTESVCFNVSMSCDGCKARIEKIIPFEKGVKDLTVNLENKTVKIVYDPKKTDETKLKTAIEKLDYSVEKIEETIKK